MDPDKGHSTFLSAERHAELTFKCPLKISFFLKRKVIKRTTAAICK